MSRRQEQNQAAKKDLAVVLPVHNGQETIEQAIRSILNQTYERFDLWVIDDASTDRTPHIVGGIDDPRLRYHRVEYRDVSRATNEAVGLTATPFIARMDADDRARPTKLERQMLWIQEHMLDVVGCQVSICSAAGDPIPSMQRYQRWINEETLEAEQIAALRFVEFPLVNPTILARREYFELGYRSNALPEDYELMLRAAEVGMKFGKVDEVLFDWVDRPQRLTRTDARYTPEAFEDCRRKYLLRGPLSDHSTVDLWGMGITGKRWLHWLQAESITVRRALEVNPRKTGRTIHNVPVIAPEEMPASDGTPLLIGVGSEGARQLILAHLEARGYVPGRDAWFVA